MRELTKNPYERRWLQGENTKHEIRNKSEFKMTKIQNGLRYSNLGF
jgi:hypothetical protein